MSDRTHMDAQQASRGLPSPRVWEPLILLSRLCLGYYIISAGWDIGAPELSDGWGSFYRSDLFQVNAEFLPESLAMLFGYTWPWLEIISGILLVIGLFGRVAAAVIAWLVLSIGIAVMTAGDFLPRHHTMVFFPFALILTVLGSGRYSVDALLRSRKLTK